MVENFQTKREKCEWDDEDPMQGTTPSKKIPKMINKVLYFRPTNAASTATTTNNAPRTCSSWIKHAS